jgi:hypothetical protein
MNLQQLQQQVQQLAPASAYVVTQGNPYSSNSFSLTMEGLRGMLLAGATAEAVLEQARDLEFVRRFGNGESVESIVGGES